MEWWAVLKNVNLDPARIPILTALDVRELKWGFKKDFIHKKLLFFSKYIIEL